MHIEPFFDSGTATFTYVVSDMDCTCAIIDPVLNYNPESGKITTLSADKIISYIKKAKLKTGWILETHIHADHLTAANYLKQKLGGKTGIGKNVVKVLKHLVPLFNNENDTPLNGSQFDKLFADGEIFTIGKLKAKVIYTPGHTPDSISYLIENAVFVGDTLFMPEVGTARTDFPGGSAKILTFMAVIIAISRPYAHYNKHYY